MSVVGVAVLAAVLVAVLVLVRCLVGVRREIVALRGRVDALVGIHNSGALQSALDAVSKAGGGATIQIPAGTFLVGESAAHPRLRRP